MATRANPYMTHTLFTRWHQWRRPHAAASLHCEAEQQQNRLTTCDRLVYIWSFILSFSFSFTNVNTDRGDEGKFTDLWHFLKKILLNLKYFQIKRLKSQSKWGHESLVLRSTSSCKSSMTLSTWVSPNHVTWAHTSGSKSTTNCAGKRKKQKQKLNNRCLIIWKLTSKITH